MESSCALCQASLSDPLSVLAVTKMVWAGVPCKAPSMQATPDTMASVQPLHPLRELPYSLLTALFSGHACLAKART